MKAGDYTGLRKDRSLEMCTVQSGKPSLLQEVELGGGSDIYSQSSSDEFGECSRVQHL
jgi:hypothetical protein